jgi:5-methylcytosine-specific restriction endonuclease McrA
MPTKWARRCKCGGKIRGDVCSKCGPITHGFRSKRTRQERGYGPDWDEAKVIAKERADYLCEDCGERGELTYEKLEVHHIVPFRSIDDPKRLDQRNLRVLCKACHKGRTKAR